MNTNRNRIVPIVVGVAFAIFAISMVMRFVLFSDDAFDAFHAAQASVSRDHYIG